MKRSGFASCSDVAMYVLLMALIWPGAIHFLVAGQAKSVAR